MRLFMLSFVVAVLSLGCTKTPLNPIETYKNDKLRDCVSSWTYHPLGEDVIAVLEPPDEALMDAYYAEKKSQNIVHTGGTLFMHVVLRKGTVPLSMSGYAFLDRKKDGTYCVRDFIGTSDDQFPHHQEFMRKYKK
jgi:hypothetical protein